MNDTTVIIMLIICLHRNYEGGGGEKEKSLDVVIPRLYLYNAFLT